MSTATTSLKLPAEIKARALTAAKRLGITPHAFMVDAIRTAAEAAQKRAEFVAQALDARREALRSGKGYAASDVHAYLHQRLSSKKASKPKAVVWRG